MNALPILSLYDFLLFVISGSIFSFILQNSFHFIVKCPMNDIGLASNKLLFRYFTVFWILTINRLKAQLEYNITSEYLIQFTYERHRLLSTIF